ncbi:spondin domain-containing protein [Aliikangiella sp. IMCC44359]|uniref:spondin domain-containing protein n=1 Tax=Aliikangiella sp. IMCC44359 TaxID=3459125 RepID=UPI00403B35E1
MSYQFSRLILRISIITGAILLNACSDNNSYTPPPPPEPEPLVKIFSIQVINLTHNQPLSPMAVILHSEGAFWLLNQSASVALETMAESGDNSPLLAESNVIVGQSGNGVLMPGNDETILIETTETGDLYLSIASMLVNTNDAFTGLSRANVTNLQVSESIRYRVGVYDSGTEANNEADGTIPGPANGGEGFNSVRDDVDFVAIHSGVISLDDGLSTSILNESHRFDNPAMSVLITRTQ